MNMHEEYIKAIIAAGIPVPYDFASPDDDYFFTYIISMLYDSVT